MYSRLLALLFTFLCIVSEPASFGAQSKTNAVLAVCAAWDQAYIDKDPAPLQRLLHPDYLGIDEDGAITTKADEIALIKTSAYVIHSVTPVEPPKVRFLGKTAIVTTHSRVNQTYRGETETLAGRATIVCTLQNRKWQIISWHASKIH
jgi:ketosteroid isomerase-like protein